MRMVRGILLGVLSSIMVVAMINCHQARAEPSIDGWSKTYGGKGKNIAFALVQSDDGGYAILGFTNSSGAGNNDFWLVKTDASGNMQWNKTYGGTSDDQAYALVQTDDGGYALAGGANVILVKTDASGNMQWNKTYEEAGFVWDLVKTGDGGYALGGFQGSYGRWGDFWLAKTDASGNMQWNMTYGGTSNDEVRALVQTADGGYALAGETGSFGVGDADFWLVKTDASGNMQWNMTYGGTDNDSPVALVRTGDGGYALAGSTSSFGAGQEDFWLVKTDASGNMQWNMTYGGTSEDAAGSLVQTDDGGYALAGYTGPFFDVGYADLLLVKTDANGNALWNKTYVGTDQEIAFALVQTADGGYALAGYTGFYVGDGYADFLLVKTDSNGVVPEFPSSIALVAFMTTVTLTAILVKKKHRVRRSCLVVAMRVPL